MNSYIIKYLGLRNTLYTGDAYMRQLPAYNRVAIAGPMNLAFREGMYFSGNSGSIKAILLFSESSVCNISIKWVAVIACFSICLTDSGAYQIIPFYKLDRI